MPKSTTKPVTRTRCEYFDLQNESKRLYVQPVDARRFVELGYASWKPGSKTEINLRSDLTLLRDPFGKGVHPLSRETARTVHKLLEPILGMKLNCRTWANLSPILINPHDLQDPRIAYMPFQQA